MVFNKTRRARLKKLLHLFLLIAFCSLVGKALYFAKDGFRLERIAPFPERFQEAKQAPLSPSVKKLLNQPFRYLSRGRQCFAFLSQDGKYVLKIPRTDSYKKPKSFPRGQFFRSSLKIAATDFKEHSQVLALHLDTTADEGYLIIEDSLKQRWKLSIGKTPFILQKAQTIWTQSFKQADNKTEILDAFIDFLIARKKLGIANKDEAFLENYGYDGEKITQLDIGSLFYTKEPYPLKDFTFAIEKWLSTQDPALSAYFHAECKERL